MIGSIRCFSRKSIASRQWLLSAHCIGTTSDTRTSQKETPVYLTSRNYSLSQPKNSLVAVGLGVAGLSVLAKYGVDAYTAFQLERKQNSENVAEKGDETDEAKVNATAQDSSEKASAETKSKKSAPEEATNPFSKFFSMFGKNYYEGGFEDKMTKREAALILGNRLLHVI